MFVDGIGLMLKFFAFLAKAIFTLIFRALFDWLSKPKIDDETQEKPIAPVDIRLCNNMSGFVLGDGILKSDTEDGHIMIVGGVGSGKTSCIAIPTLFSWNESVFAVDIKSELYAKTKHNPNRITMQFNPLDPHTLGYDPFYLLKHTTNQVQEAQAIAHALIPLPPRTDDPFWI